MPDPAIEAAQRAWDATDGFGFDSSRDAMEEAAREALATIRDWYENLPAASHVPDVDALLPLIYPDAEL